MCLTYGLRCSAKSKGWTDERIAVLLREIMACLTRRPLDERITVIIDQLRQKLMPHANAHACARLTTLKAALFPLHVVSISCHGCRPRPPPRNTCMLVAARVHEPRVTLLLLLLLLLPPPRPNGYRPCASFASSPRDFCCNRNDSNVAAVTNDRSLYANIAPRLAIPSRRSG